MKKQVAMDAKDTEGWQKGERRAKQNQQVTDKMENKSCN